VELKSVAESLEQLHSLGAKAHADATTTVAANAVPGEGRGELFHDHLRLCVLPAKLLRSILQVQSDLATAAVAWNGQMLSTKPTQDVLDRVTYHLFDAFPGTDSDRIIAELVPDGGTEEGAPERVRRRRRKLRRPSRRRGRPRKESN
jgi:hypothetical protein